MAYDFPPPIGRMRRVAEVVRYYQAGILNAAFGFGAYALFVWLGVDPFLAQAAATVLGVMFNYYTYSRHVFYGSAPAKSRFALSYLANYLVSVALLAAAQRFVGSPYAAGLIAIILTSFVNYFALRYLVFTRQQIS